MIMYDYINDLSKLQTKQRLLECVLQENRLLFQFFYLKNV